MRKTDFLGEPAAVPTHAPSVAPAPEPTEAPSLAPTPGGQQRKALLLRHYRSRNRSTLTSVRNPPFQISIFEANAIKRRSLLPEAFCTENSCESWQKQYTGAVAERPRTGPAR